LILIQLTVVILPDLQNHNIIVLFKHELSFYSN